MSIELESVMCPDCRERIVFRHYTNNRTVTQPCICMCKCRSAAEIRETWNGHLKRLQQRGWPIPEGAITAERVDDPNDY